MTMLETPAGPGAGPRLRGAPGLQEASEAVRSRDVALDLVRGLAIVLMVADHLAAWHPALHWLRDTVTRASMPLFFLVSGHLAHRLKWRHAAIGVVGLGLPLVVPWIDQPNVLVLYAVGVVILWLGASIPMFRLAVVVAALTIAANSWATVPDGVNAYVPVELWGLMALGAMLPRELFGQLGDTIGRSGRHVAGVLAWVGRRPLSVYVCHLLVIEAFVVIWRLS